ncbi:hypothetical protein AGLY_012681 [Aphis glycines]|uniref:Uncharacterized protein n=1 Tax=Aphis glycines TaxID=307491 RepID=A0A6G0T8A4_APHGL|nr:hypothetical protein AGLY_012681 [Aphis glycines]
MLIVFYYSADVAIVETYVSVVVMVVFPSHLVTDNGCSIQKEQMGSVVDAALCLHRTRGVVEVRQVGLLLTDVEIVGNTTVLELCPPCRQDLVAAVTNPFKRLRRPVTSAPRESIIPRDLTTVVTKIAIRHSLSLVSEDKSLSLREFVYEHLLSPVSVDTAFSLPLRHATANVKRSSLQSLSVRDSSRCVLSNTTHRSSLGETVTNPDREHGRWTVLPLPESPAFSRGRRRRI